MPGELRQVAPYPVELAALVEQVSYRPGWSFRLEECGRHAGAHGLTLIVSVETVDSYHHDRPYTVTHYMWVPPESYNRAAWSRWLFDQIVLVERHEAMENFAIGGKRIFKPGHGGGHSPYYPLPA
jgi:hypothetical protein